MGREGGEEQGDDRHEPRPRHLGPEGRGQAQVGGDHQEAADVQELQGQEDQERGGNQGCALPGLRGQRHEGAGTARQGLVQQH